MESNGLKLSDWVTEEEFNYSPTGELSEAIELAMVRKAFVKGGLDYDWTNGTSVQIESLLDEVLSWNVSNDMITELITKISGEIK